MLTKKKGREKKALESGVEGCLTPNMAEGEINIDNLIQRLLEGKRYFVIFMDFL